MSLPDWNDLSNEARKAGVDALDYSGVDENWQGQYALDVYNAIREHVPPEVFPLFQQPMEAPQKNKLGLAPCPFCGGDAAFGSITYSPRMVDEQGWEQDTFHSVNCVRCGTNNKGMVGWVSEKQAAEHWNRRMPGADVRPRVRVRAGRRVRGSWSTDAYALVSAILEFESRLPGFWWSVGQCSVGAHASCAVDGRGDQRVILEGVIAGDPLDAGFDADTRGGSPADAIRKVMQMALADPRVIAAGESRQGTRDERGEI